MNVSLSRLVLAVASVGLLTLSGCGGGSSTPAVTPPTTTSVPISVIDGPIQGAVVCLDKNNNGVCDVGEPQGATDATGNVTLQVDPADVGKYPVVAAVGVGAVDAVNGPVTTAYNMTAPADQTAVVTPLTTLVQQTVATTGVTTAAAAQTIQNATGISVSLFADPATMGSTAVSIAHMVVLTSQQLATTLAPAVGTPIFGGTSKITPANLTEVVQTELLSLLPAVVSAASSAPSGSAATAAAADVVTSAGVTTAGAPVLVAATVQNMSPPPTSTPSVSAFATLVALNFTDVYNYFFRQHSGSVTQATPDPNNNYRYVDRRVQSVGNSTQSSVAKWGTGGNPARNADLHWNGSAWVNCPINFENVASVRDAQGNSTYNHCDGFETGKTNRATFDVSNLSMASVYAQIVAGGYTNLNIASASTTLGAAVFPTNSQLFIQQNTPLTEAISYYPGDYYWTGSSDVVTQYSAAVSAGGIAANQPAGQDCNSSEKNTSGTNSTTLGNLIAAKTGTPCIYPQESFVYNGVTYTGPSANEAWGFSTLGIGKIGTAPVGSGAAPGFFSGNTLLRMAFTGAGSSEVTYYACQERFNNGATRNCMSIGTGSYTITTLGDARVLTLNNLPAQAGPLNFTRVYVERGGYIYAGYQNKPNVSNQARLNITAANALLTQLGLTPEDPTVPLALTTGSYHSTWDLKSSANSYIQVVSPTDGGPLSCFNMATASSPVVASTSCSGTVTDPATGAFTYTNVTGSSTVTFTGNLDFLTGVVTVTASTDGLTWTGLRQ